MTGLGADGRLMVRFTENEDSKTTPSIIRQGFGHDDSPIRAVAGTPELLSGSLRLRVRSGETHRFRGVESQWAQSPG
jgi:hypothetical protein